MPVLQLAEMQFERSHSWDSNHTTRRGGGTVRVIGHRVVNMSGQLLMPRSMEMGMLQERHDAINPTK